MEFVSLADVPNATMICKLTNDLKPIFSFTLVSLVDNSTVLRSNLSGDIYTAGTLSSGSTYYFAATYMLAQ